MGSSLANECYIWGDKHASFLHVIFYFFVYCIGRCFFLKIEREEGDNGEKERDREL